MRARAAAWWARSGIIPTGNGKRAVVHPAALLAAVDRVATISTERGRAVRLGLADGALTLDVVNPDSGSARDEIEAGRDRVHTLPEGAR
jgi:DNA polymerase-3 subunit beta